MCLRRLLARLFRRPSPPVAAPSPIETYRRACESTKARLDQADLDFGRRVATAQADIQAKRIRLDVDPRRDPRRLDARPELLDGLRRAVAEGNADRAEGLFYRMPHRDQEGLLEVLRKSFGPTFALRGPREPAPFWLAGDLLEDGLTYELVDEPPRRIR